MVMLGEGSDLESEEHNSFPIHMTVFSTLTLNQKHGKYGLDLHAVSWNNS